MAKKYTLQAVTRDRFGKGEMRRMRREGRVPAVLYGPGEKTLAMSVDNQEISHLLHEITVENTLIELELAGKDNKKYQTLIREVQRHPYRPVLQHVDFYCVPEGRKVHLEVPIVLHGIPFGVRNQSGLVQHVLRDLEILVLPSNIPEQLVVDITELKIGESIHVENLPKGDFDILTEGRQTVVTVVPPVVVKVAAAEEEMAEELEEGPTEPEVIGEKKESEEQ
ncbi:MAG TPA: 50S ribosomal protein L25 [archaeon]|nr:50S ribosomal protein L25 [archaeon]